MTCLALMTLTERCVLPLGNEVDTGVLGVALLVRTTQGQVWFFLTDVQTFFSVQ